MPATLERRSEVAVEYPRKGEVITARAYTVRISAPGAQRVELSIDGNAPVVCVESGGTFRHEWAGFVSGDHELLALAHYAGGSLKVTLVRRAVVDHSRTPTSRAG